MKFPKGGLNYFLNNKLKFEQVLKLWLIYAAAEKGLHVSFDSRRISNAYALWKNRAGNWGRELSTRKMDRSDLTQQFVDINDAASGLSHNKLAGTLLWALNRTQPISNLSKLSDERKNQLQIAGVNYTTAGKLELITSFPNEFLMFQFVESVFWQMQEERNKTTRVELGDPPMTRHYLHNTCYYLRNCDPSPESLYMIFKTFDLMGLVHDD